MQRIFFILTAILFSCACHAMLVTPSSDAEAADAVRDAINRRTASEASAEWIARVKQQESEQRSKVLNSIKNAAPSVQPQFAEESFGGSLTFEHYLAICLGLALPLAFLAVHWLTRRAVAARDRERAVVLRTSASQEKRVPSGKTTKILAPQMPLKDFLAMRLAKEAEERTNEQALPGEDERDSSHDTPPTPPPGGQLMWAH